MVCEKVKCVLFWKLDLIKIVEYDNLNRLFMIFIGDIIVFILFIFCYKRDRG